MHALPAASLPTSARQLVHDLRTLFGVVASAHHCLGDLPQDDRSRSLLTAIEQAAARGSVLTTELLTARKGSPDILDVDSRLECLEPMLRAITGPTVDLRLDAGAIDTPIHMRADDFDAVLVELVVNACKALRARGRILVRTRGTGASIRLNVAGNGRSMTSIAARAAERGQGDRAGAHRTGLARVHRFASEANGQLQIRSRRGRGTIVSLMLPTAATGLSP